MRRTIASVLWCVMIAATMAHAQTTPSALNKIAGEGFFQETEVRYWDAARAQSGYTLFGAMGRTYLIDMEGYVVNQWNLGTNPRLLENGDLLDATKSDPSGFGGFRELDWNGNTVWEYAEKRTNYAPHHDWIRIFNKKLNAYTTLYIANKTVTKDQALAAGANPASGAYTDVQVDAIVEVDMTGAIVWEWWFFDHIIQDFDATKPNYTGTGKTIASYPGKININMPGNPLKKDWLHCNTIDYNDSLGQIVTNSVQGELYIIDHDKTFIAGDPAGSIALAATSAGDFLYRFGDPVRYGQGTAASATSTGNKQIGGSHDVHWIRPGLPGEGKLQIFNNGEYLLERVSQSYIFEIDPYLNAKKVNTGSYVNPPDAGYYTWIYPNKDAMKANKLISNQVVWIYSSKNDQSFFSTIGGSEQRLPNGNTLICSDTQGHLFEVTYGDTAHSPEVVWEYVNPVTAEGIKQVITDQYPMYNSVFRAYRYGADHPALKGRTLSKGRTITGKVPQYWTPAGLLTETAETRSQAPQEFSFMQNYPNPFNPSTMLRYCLPAASQVRVHVFNVLGQRVAELVNAEQAAGWHAVQWRADGASGVYFCRLEAESKASPGTRFVDMKKMLLMR